MEQQTAVEWLYEQIKFTNKDVYNELFEQFEQAKQIENEQREKDYNKGFEEGYTYGKKNKN